MISKGAAPSALASANLTCSLMGGTFLVFFQEREVIENSDIACTQEQLSRLLCELIWILNGGSQVTGSSQGLIERVRGQMQYPGTDREGQRSDAVSRNW